MTALELLDADRLSDAYMGVDEDFHDLDLSITTPEPLEFAGQAAEGTPPGNAEEPFFSWPAYWTCRPAIDGRDAVALIGEHAPGVVLARMPDEPAHRDVGLTTVEHGGDQAHDDMRLAIAFVCCGNVPPPRLVLKALKGSGAAELVTDDRIRDAFRRSMKRVASEAQDQMALLDEAPSPRP